MDKKPYLTRGQANALYGALKNSNEFSGPSNKFNNGFVWGVQTFATSAAWSGTVSNTSGGTIINFTGTGTGGTLSLPAAPAIGYLVVLQIPGAILPLTLNAGGTTQIGSSTSIFLSTGGGVNQAIWLYFDGTAYQQLGGGSIIASQFSFAMNFNQRTSFYGPVSYRVQSFSGAATIVTTSGSGGSMINKSGAGAYTLALPTGPSTGDTLIFIDGQGDAGASNLSISSSDKAINGTAAGGGSVVVVNTNYGRGIASYNGTRWIVKPG